MVLKPGKWLLGTAVLLACAAAGGQTVQQAVQQAVNTELRDDAQDHTHWLYYEVDLAPGNSVEQWVAQTSQGSVKRLINQNGKIFSKQQQIRAMDAFIDSPGAQARQRKGARHDNREATQLLRLLPQAFLWTKGETHDGETVYLFRPNPDFTPPSLEARVFAAMAGKMTVDDMQHRIARLKGTLIHDVKFLFGLLGRLQAGGTFEVKRQQLAPGVWQITKAHIHIQGHALIFKSISEQEDDVKWNFKRLPDDMTLAQAKELLMQQDNSGR